ncbi:hypothetical protein [Falsibacillus pallidus]|uniref:Uncharacterized protein n=1 Tax=Falsibacillus pallidus TaxID=493781 RepID=A0A370G7Y9_9BACI|nr:hypothetical protein [Falsibacillus pallidus]RDI39897.1 hypothetical protein DFR59_11455 [Falsibacillus pallidus]
MFNTTFSETYVASYLKTKMKEFEDKVKEDGLSSEERIKIDGKMEAYQEFLDHFELDRYELKED